MLEGCREPGLPGMAPVQEEFRSEDCSRGSPPVTAVIIPCGVAPLPGSILLDYDGTGTADFEWCLVAGRCHPGGGVGRVAPPPAHPTGLGGFSLPPLSKLGQLFCSAACGPGLAWCTNGLGGILWVACPPVRRRPGLCPKCHLTSLFSRLSPGGFAGRCASCCSVLPLLDRPKSRDFLGVSQPLHEHSLACILSPFLIGSSGPSPEVG